MATVLVQDGTLQARRHRRRRRAHRQGARDARRQGRARSPRPARRRRSRCSASTACPKRARPSTPSPTRRPAKELVEHRRDARRKKELAGTAKVSLENILEKIKEGAVKELKIVLKADVQGSAEALKAALIELVDRARSRSTSSRPASAASPRATSTWPRRATRSSSASTSARPARRSQLAEQEGVDIKLYDIIYEALDDVKKAMVGPARAGQAREVRSARPRCARSSRSRRSAPSPAASSPRARSSATSQVRAGARLGAASTRASSRRCGASRTTCARWCRATSAASALENFNDIKVGDIIEAYEIEEIAATLRVVASRRAWSSESAASR